MGKIAAIFSVLFILGGCVERRSYISLYNNNDYVRRDLIDRHIRGVDESVDNQWTNAYSIVYPVCETELHNLIVHALVRDSVDCTGDITHKLRLDLFEYRREANDDFEGDISVTNIKPDAVASGPEGLNQKKKDTIINYIIISSKYRENPLDERGLPLSGYYQGPLLIFVGSMNYRDNSILINQLYTYQPYKKCRRKRLVKTDVKYNFNIRSNDKDNIIIDRITVTSENKYGSRYGAVYNLTDIMQNDVGLHLKSLDSVPIPKIYRDERRLYLDHD